jgi:hypothetical protein
MAAALTMSVRTFEARKRRAIRASRVGAMMEAPRREVHIQFIQVAMNHNEGPSGAAELGGARQAHGARLGLSGSMR